jgi:transposase
MRSRQRRKLAEKDAAAMERELRRVELLNRRLQLDKGRLERKNGRLERKIDELDEQIDRLKKELEAARRAGKRQAAPFSKGAPKKNPRKPGRKSGKDGGPRAHREPPPRVDETLDAPLPRWCPDCHGSIEEIGVKAQYQTELPAVEPHSICFQVHVGKCTACGKRIQGRHHQQTSDALGAAASQLGPRAQSFASGLHARYGMSFGKIKALFLDTFDIAVSRGGIYQVTARVARVLEPTYGAFHIWIRRAPVISPDETGWKIGGLRHWLWAFATPELALYSIQRGRGFEEAAKILGKDYSGTLVRDGWAVYRKFVQARHQTCLAHLLRRCAENLETALRGTARVPHAVRALLKRALELRDRALEADLTPHGLRSQTGTLRARLDRLLRWKPTDDENRKLLKHIETERQALFTFLDDLTIPATNYWSEQAIRPAVVNRKVFGGNRTQNGAWALERQTSFFETCRRQKHDPKELLVQLLRAPHPQILDILAPSWVVAPPTSPP